MHYVVAFCILLHSSTEEAKPSVLATSPQIKSARTLPSYGIQQQTFLFTKPFFFLHRQARFYTYRIIQDTAAWWIKSISLTYGGGNRLEHSEDLLHVDGLLVRKKKYYFKKQTPRALSITLTLLIEGWCSRTLNLTVLARGLHWPMVTISPSVTFTKHGEQWAASLWWRFSNLHKLGQKDETLK